LKDLGCDIVRSAIGRQTQAFDGKKRVISLVLIHESLDLRREAMSSTFLTKQDQDTGTHFVNKSQRKAKLRKAITVGGVQYHTGDAFRSNTTQDSG